MKVTVTFLLADLDAGQFVEWLKDEIADEDGVLEKPTVEIQRVEVEP